MVSINSKQIVAAIGIVALLIIVVYPALTTSTVALQVQSIKIDKADHVYVTVNSVWAHRAGQASEVGWELVSNQTKMIDLVSLANSQTALGKGEISVADYDMVRIQISNVSWVFNKTTTHLSVQSPELPTDLDFTVKAGQETMITLVLSGQQENLEGTKFFMPSLNATLPQST